MTQKEPHFSIMVKELMTCGDYKHKAICWVDFLTFETIFRNSKAISKTN